MSARDGEAVVEREVSASTGEFERGLDLAFPGRVERIGSGYRVAACDATMEIGVTPGPERVIALLRLPTIRVLIRFTGGDATSRARLLAHLDLATHRGGG